MNSTENKTVRITKAMRFEDIKAYLAGNELPHGSTVEDLTAFADNEIALLARKNASGGEKKPTERQTENESIKQDVLDYMASILPNAEGVVPAVTCDDLRKNVEGLKADLNVNRTAALMRQLVNAGKVVRGKAKGKTVFSLA